MSNDGEYQPSPRTQVRDQVELYERTSGTEGNTMRGRPVVILTCLGARTGAVRKVPLMRVEHDGEYALVASMGGAPEHPVWYHNLRAHPLVQLQDGAEVREMTAHEASGDERTLWWDRAVAAWPDYAAYQEKTSRRIPVFVLSPTSTD